jgi:two-component system chemotaxis sensor kinase CheA
LALDMAKYQKLFLEEANEYFAEISNAMLTLEKDTSSTESIDTIFRMAHSIKSMAASLGHDSVSELSHRLEDRMQRIRATGCVSGPEELGLLFKGLEGLESLVEAIRQTGEAPAPDDALMALLEPEAASATGPGGDPSKKKVLS